MGFGSGGVILRSCCPSGHDRTDAPPNDYTATSRHFIPSKSDESQNDTQSRSMALEDELANWARIMVR